MVILSNQIENRLRNLSLKTNNLFADISVKILKKKCDIVKNYNEANFKTITSQIPDGIYSNIDDLIAKIQQIAISQSTKNISYSPLNQTYKIFDACKKISYSKGNIITGREKEIDKVLLTLSRKNKRGLILIGEPGTGKTAIIREINTRLINGTVPFPLKGVKLHNLDIPWIFTHYKDDPISKIIEILETANADPKHILFIDEVHQLLNEKFNDILKPYLTEDIRFIGSTTIDEYHNIVTEDKAIERRFTIINVNEPSINETVKMVINTKKVYEQYHNCSITDELCKYTVENGSRFLGHRKNPDKSFDILDKACSIMNIKGVRMITTALPSADPLVGLDNDLNDMRGETLVSTDQVLTKKYIDLAISDIAGIDYNYIKNSLDYNFISSELKSKITGQDSAMNELANIANIMKHVGYNRTRPITIGLIVGTHGVGKSKSVNLLAELLYGSKNSVIEYDLAEFSQEFQLTELKGAPPGYVGYQKSGKLIKEIRNNPQSIVYLKHINKCHPNIAEYLLTSIKNGKLVDSAEREVSLNNTIIIFSVSLEESDDKTVSKGSMGFAMAGDDGKGNLDKIVNKNILDAVDTVIRYNNLTDVDMDFIFNSNVDATLEMYNNVEIDRVALKNKVFEESCKNGNDIINRLTSIIPKMIFEEIGLDENEKSNTN